MRIEDNRLKLDKVLRSIIGDRNTYYRSPINTQLSYPCVIYDLANIDLTHADNIPYITKLQYKVTLIDEDPDSGFVDELLNLPYCALTTNFENDGLNHFVFSLYY